MDKPLIIAYYLPQYHPFKENDDWWGKGFTEWTNVGKAKPLFKGHLQPNVPADLGYYDLRVPEVREEQARLAREAGIDGFCYYHYWFENGKEVMQTPFNEVVKSKHPDFPFCICWANESWGRKMWNKDGSVASQEILAEQKYLGKEDNEKHFYSLLEAFKDSRYMTIDGHPIFVIYRACKFVNVEQFINQWNQLAVQNGIKSFHFIGVTEKESEIEEILAEGFDAVNYMRLFPENYKYPLLSRIIRRVINIPRVTPYKKVAPFFNSEVFKDERVCPDIIPNWDHTPRSGSRGLVYYGSTPQLFKRHVLDILNTISDKENKLVFLKSWNEWGEGNYMEPDLRFGHGYIKALKEALEINM